MSSGLVEHLTNATQNRSESWRHRPATDRVVMSTSTLPQAKSRAQCSTHVADRSSRPAEDAVVVDHPHLRDHGFALGLGHSHRVGAGLPRRVLRLVNPHDESSADEGASERVS